MKGMRMIGGVHAAASNIKMQVLRSRGVSSGMFGHKLPPGLGPSAPPPPLPEAMKKAAPALDVQIPQTAFKLLKDAPKLELSTGGEPWEVGMTVHQWRVETRNVMPPAHPSFADYFDKIYDQVRQRYEAKRLTGLEEPVPKGFGIGGRDGNSVVADSFADSSFGGVSGRGRGFDVDPCQYCQVYLDARESA